MDAMEKPEQLWPYPKDLLTRIGFAIGDLVCIGIILLVFVPIILSFR